MALRLEALEMTTVMPRTRSATNHQTSGEAGFTLLEVLIATTLFIFVMLIATQVLLEANTLLIRSSNEEVNILPGAALALVRHDIHIATDLSGFPGTPWITTPLVLQHKDGATIYSLDDNDCLMRRSVNEDTVVIGERCVLKNAVGLRWRFVDSGVLEVRVDTSIWQEPSGVARLDDVRFRQGRSTTRSHGLTAMARASRRGSSW